MRAKRFIQFLAAALLVASLPGCAGMSARWSAYLQCKADERALKRKMVAEDLQALRDELEAERRAIQAERALDLARQRADCEKRTCQARSQYDESVRTKLGLDLDQRVSIGQMQVNLPELQRLMADRELDYAERMRTFNAIKNQQRQADTEKWKRDQQAGPTCSCAEPSCAAPGPSCDAPLAGGCCCQRCGLPIVSPERGNDCAGTRPFREGPRKPVRQPIMATELPMMLPVKLEVGVTNSYLNESQIRRMPYEKSSAAQMGPCGQCQGCRCGQPCQRYSAPSCDTPQSPMQPIPESGPLPGSDGSDTVPRPTPQRGATRWLREPTAVDGALRKSGGRPGKASTLEQASWEEEPATPPASRPARVRSNAATPRPDN